MKISNILPLAFVMSFSSLIVSCEKPSSAPADTETAMAEEEDHGHDHAEGDHAHDGEAGERIKHLEVPDVTSAEDAKTIFLERTAEITGKEKLDTQELHEIHMATYHLETAVAYYAENSEGARKEAAEKLAVVVEEVHLSSEGFKPEEARKHIAEFARLAEAFSAGL